MKKTFFHLVLGLSLSGCTINQYGPSVALGEHSLGVTQSTINDNSQVDNSQHSGRDPVRRTGQSTAQTPAKKPVDKPVVVTPLPKEHEKPRRTPGCIPAPSIPEPPKLDVEKLKQYQKDPAKLEELFKENHAALYSGWKEIRTKFIEWEKNPNRC